MNAGPSTNPNNAYLIPLPRAGVAYMTDRYVRRRTEASGASEYFHDIRVVRAADGISNTATPGLAVAKHKQ